MTIPASVVTMVQPWATFYSNSQPVSIGITFLHLAGVMVGGGRAVAADADLLGAMVPDDAVVTRIGQAHRIVIPALILTTLTGLLMVAGDLETFAESTAFAVKLVTVALLGANGALLWAAERRLSRRDGGGWSVARLAAGASITLWLLTLLAGCWLQVAA